MFDLQRYKQNLFLILIFVLGLQIKVFAVTDLLPAKTQKVQHPLAADGLIRIDRDGNYIYKQPIYDSHQTSHVKFGAVSNPDVSTRVCKHDDPSNCQDVSFNQMYRGASKMTFEYQYDYFLIEHKGKLGITGSLSAQYAEGHGRLLSDPTQESEEKFSFLTLPLSAGLIYRFQYQDRQKIVPFATGGGSYVVLVEKREDKSDMKAIGAFGFFGSGGILVNLTAFDRDLAADFATEYDIKNLWINLEFKYVSVTSDAFDFGNGFIQGGIAFDF